MAGSSHIILTGVSLPDFILYVEHQRLAATLVICSSRDAFLDQLRATCMQALDLPSAGAAETDGSEETGDEMSSKHRLLQQPSLRMLATSQRIRLAFCSDISHLRAYLSTYKAPSCDEGKLLAVVDIVALHRPTSAFSAQGLNRTFTLAIEAALRTNSRLVISECLVAPPRTTQPDKPQDVPAGDEAAEEAPSALASDPWDEEVSILNVTTKSFGAGGRGWVGRTIKIKRIAERWCCFEQWAARNPSP